MNGSDFAQRIIAIEQRLQELKAIGTPGNYASGNVLFGGANGKAATDAALIWDNTNKRLGIGATPSGFVHIRAAGSSKTFFLIEDTAASADTLIDLIGTSISNTSYFIRARTATPTDRFYVKGDGSAYFDAAVQFGNKISLGGTAVSINGNFQSIANTAVIDLGMIDFGFAFVQAASLAGIFAINGSTHTTVEISDPSNVYSATAGTANSINIYWSAGNSRYELENRRGSTINARIWLFTST